jgi:coatomer protein complex subunit alpha (xenin)
MLKIANMRDDIMGRYHNALLLGDAEERVRVLESSGNFPLAYICAMMHGLKEDSERIRVTIETNGGSVDGLMDKVVATDPKSAGCLLQPPTPIVRESNWPTLEVQKTTLEDLSAADTGVGTGDDDYQDEKEAANQAQDLGTADWEDDEPNAGGAIAAAADDLGFDDGDLGDWGDDLDDLGDLGGSGKPKDDSAVLTEITDSATGMPNAGKAPLACWVANSSHAADHLAAGSASSGLQLLHRQIAASDFSVLKSNMIGAYLGSMMSVPGMLGCPSLHMPLLRNDSQGHPGEDSLPRPPLRVRDLVNGIRNGYKFFQAGKFNDCKASFVEVLTQIPLAVSESPAEASEMKEMVAISREYVTSIRIKAAISEAAEDPVRATELSAYFTRCNLQSVHLLLALRSAMGTAFKHKNFIVAAGFARRLLELPEMSSERNADLRVKATKVLQKSEQMARNEHQLNYDESKAFKIDCQTFYPIYSGQPCVECPYCGSAYADTSMTNKLCLTCMFCTVGVQTIGLVTG